MQLQRAAITTFSYSFHNSFSKLVYFLFKNQNKHPPPAPNNKKSPTKQTNNLKTPNKQSKPQKDLS